MTPKKGNGRKKKAKHPSHPKKINTLRLDLNELFQGYEDLTERTPLQLIVIANYLNRLNFINTINNYVKWDPDQWKYSPGVLAQLLILAVFIPAHKKVALSRIHQVYAGMDLEILVGEPIDPDDLSDHLFASMLDRLFQAGCDKLLSTIALTVRTVFNLPPNYILHSDTTSHVLYGDYDSSEYESNSSIIHPTYGYSKDKRNDLKQIMTGMVTDGDGLIRISHVLDGNTSDGSYNHLMIKTLQEVYGEEFYQYTYIADSKMLNKKNLELINEGNNPVKIISHIPENFSGSLAKRVRNQAYEKQEWASLGICCEHPAGKGKEPEYWVQTFEEKAYGFPVWVHIYKSGDAERRLKSKIEKERVNFEAELKSLTEKTFACEPDANTELLRFHQTHSKSFFSVSLSPISSVIEKNPVGRPSANPKPKKIEVSWSIRAGEIIRNDEKIELQRQKDESFSLLTNISPEVFSSREVLLRYKGQHKVEHNFSVLKMPLLASTLFLEKPQRIEAMMTLLYFSVLMHGIIQVISRMRIATCEEPPRLGAENRPLIRPKSETMLSILELFEIVTNGDAVSIRSKMRERRTQLKLILYLVDFKPDSI